MKLRIKNIYKASTFKVYTSINSIIAILCLSTLLPSVFCRLDECEYVNNDGITVYKACDSDGTMLHNADVGIKIEPEDITCGSTKEPYCRMVS